MKNIIERNFSLLLIIGVIIGFFVPSFGENADEIVIFLTATLIFLACADIKPVDFFNIDVFQVGLFTLLRFAMFPLILFFGATSFAPDFAIGILLMALMPAGVAVASLCSMSGASVVIGLSLTIMSSLLAPAFIPSVFAFLGQLVAVDVFSLFLTLIYVVFVPICAYFLLFSKRPKAEKFIREYNKSSSIIVLASILVIVIATQKNEFLSNPDLILRGTIVMTILIGCFYIFGIVFSFFVPKDHRVSYIFGSGAMNNSLAVGLAFAYFDATTTLFIVLSEIVWSVYVAGAQWYFSRQHRKIP